MTEYVVNGLEHVVSFLISVLAIDLLCVVSVLNVGHYSVHGVTLSAVVFYYYVWEAFL